MKNQYAGDIGDFGKYLLLNFLCYEYNSLVKLDYKLGVNWYLTENDDTNHGNDIEYLKEDKENLKSCLPPYSNHVYEKMLNIINNERTISSIEKLNVLPTNAIFYNDIITVQERKSWLNNSVKHLGKSNLIFCDPDNSIIASNNKNNINSMLAEELKLYYSEIEANFIIYFQHRWREGSISNNINQIIVPILKEMDPHIRFRVLIYNKGKSKRLYVIINKLKDIKLYLKLDLLLNIIDENIFYELPMTPMNNNTNRTIETDNEIIIEDFPAGNNSELILARKIARMENFKNVVPAIDNPREL